jgi:outer membrane biosynthesis protein TonB
MGLASFPKLHGQHKIIQVHDLSGAHHRIGMYLAGILALCALLHVSASGRVRGEFSSSGTESARSMQSPAQEPAKSDTPPDPSQQPKQDTPPSAPAQAEPSQPAANAPADASPSDQPTPADPKAPAPPKKPSTRKKQAQPEGEESQKKVIHRGSTVEPAIQLAPGMTEEQAARQRKNTNQLLASTDASLQKLSGRQLTKDEQDTVAQIRRFMQQVKTADAAGDLQRAYKLAVKAHLLSDALAKP